MLHLRYTNQKCMMPNLSYMFLLSRYSFYFLIINAHKTTFIYQNTSEILLSKNFYKGMFMRSCTNLETLTDKKNYSWKFDPFLLFCCYISNVLFIYKQCSIHKSNKHQKWNVNVSLGVSNSWNVIIVILLIWLYITQMAKLCKLSIS